MLTNSGFVTVVDTASDSENTIALRQRVEGGEVKGPHIYTAVAALYPPHAIPFYIQGLPSEVLAHLPQPESPAEASAAVKSNIAVGTDIVKRVQCRRLETNPLQTDRTRPVERVWLLQRNWQVTVVDISDVAIQKLDQKARQLDVA